MEFIDLKAQYRALQGEIDANIQRILAGAHFIGGEEVAEFEEKLAAYVGRKHCVSCGNGTDALQLVYMAYGIGAGDAVFCPDMTFIASVEPACMLGAAPVFCDIEPDTYNLDPVSLEAHIQSVLAEGTLRPRAVVAVDFLGNPAKYDEIGAICKEAGVPFHTDAVQAAGHLHINVKEENIDMLSLSGHKFHGPKGVGALYVRKGFPLVNIIEGGAQERGKRAGTENIPAICGMAAALKEACDHIDENAAKVSAMRDKLIEGLSKIPHSAVNGDLVHRLPGNVSFCFEGIEGESLLLLLDQKGICASSGSACTSGSLDPSHVLLAIGRVHDVAHGSLRLSLCEWNTMEEMDYILKCVPEVVEYLRGMSPVWRDLQTGKRTYIL